MKNSRYNLRNCEVDLRWKKSIHLIHLSYVDATLMLRGCSHGALCVGRTAQYVVNKRKEGRSGVSVYIIHVIYGLALKSPPWKLWPLLRPRASSEICPWFPRSMVYNATEGTRLVSGLGWGAFGSHMGNILREIGDSDIKSIGLVFVTMSPGVLVHAAPSYYFWPPTSTGILPDGERGLSSLEHRFCVWRFLRRSVANMFAYC